MLTTLRECFVLSCTGILILILNDDDDCVFRRYFSSSDAVILESLTPAYLHVCPKNISLNHCSTMNYTIFPKCV